MRKFIVPALSAFTLAAAGEATASVNADRAGTMNLRMVRVLLFDLV